MQAIKVNFEQNFNEFNGLFYEKHYSYWGVKKFKSDFKYIVKLSNYYLHIDTPVIQTSFCYADDYDDYNDRENPSNSWNKIRNAETNQEHFKRKNLERVEEWINILENENNVFFMTKKYSDCENIIYIQNANYYGFYDNPIIVDRWSGRNLVKGVDYIRLLTQEERETLLQAYYQIKEDFEKRLNTYLKRYGLSKVHAWSYWANR